MDNHVHVLVELPLIIQRSTVHRQIFVPLNVIQTILLVPILIRTDVVTTRVSIIRQRLYVIVSAPIFTGD